jgi:hypothetical protein
MKGFRVLEHLGIFCADFLDIVQSATRISHVKWILSCLSYKEILQVKVKKSYLFFQIEL